MCLRGVGVALTPIARLGKHRAVASVALQPRTTGRLASLPVVIITGSLLLGFLSLLLPSAPTYDPIAWLIWGREIAHLDLSTVHGPSWKPLPVIVTTITAPLGEASLYIWVAVFDHTQTRHTRHPRPVRLVVQE